MALKAKFVGREAVTRKIREVAPEVEKAYAKGIEDGAKELANAIRPRAPRQFGDYAQTIQAAPLSSRPNGLSSVGIGTTKDPNAWGIFADWYWRFLEFGTRSHIIKARRGGRLKFVARDGKRVSARQVSHPGTPRMPHIFPTYRAYRKRIRRRIASAINKALRQKFGGTSG